MSTLHDDETVTLKSSDGKAFVVAKAVAIQSQTIKNALEDMTDENIVIPVQEVNGKTLAKIVSYCRKHAKEPSGEDGEAVDDMRKWDEVFVTLDQAILYDLLMAANYLNIPSLIDLVTTKVAEMIRGKTVAHIRRKFKIQNDFTKEEDEKIRKKYGWAFQFKMILPRKKTKRSEKSMDGL